MRRPERRAPTRCGRGTSGPARGRPVLALALLAGLAACRAAAPARERSAAAPAAVLPDPERQRAFRSLGAALEAGEDELAGRLLAGLEALELAPAERAWVSSCARILEGRALVRTLELALESEPVAGDEGRRRLLLRARTSAPRGLELELPVCDLEHLRASIDARGLEGFDYGSRVTHALGALRLAPGEERRLELLTYDLPLGRALAVRDRWRLETRSGALLEDGERLPAARVRVVPCEAERLSPLLDPGPVQPSTLAEALARPEPPDARAWLELALRIPRAERERALAELAPVVARLARSDPERVAAAEPALRWLSGERGLGTDGRAWARHLALRSAASPDDESARDGLDLPATREAP